jgi:Putative rhamnosyl transferase
MPDPFRNQIAGLIRFSFPSTDGFTRSRPASTLAHDGLYAPERLDARFRLFERLTLPSLMAQTDPDFQVGVLIGADLPDASADRLQALLAPLKAARMIALPTGAHFSSTQRAFEGMAQDHATHLTGFRLDDDDAIDRDFIARLRERSGVLAPLHGLSRPVCIGCNRGLQLTLDKAGNRLVAVTERMPIGIGLAMTAPKGFRESIFRRNHRILPQFYSTFTDAEVPAFIRTVHADNDSNPHASGVTAALTPTEADAVLAAHFPFSYDDLMAV